MNEYFRLLTKIRIHSTFWLVLGIGVITAQFIPLCMLFFIVIIHELGHAIAAQFYSWRIKSIKLLPFGGALETEEHGNRGLKEDLIVALSGPAQHIWLCILGYALMQAQLITQDSFYQFFYMNAVIFLFNLLPIWPLDGGKVIFVLLSLKFPFLDAHRHTIAASTVIAGIGLLAFSFLAPNNLNMWVMVLFILFSLLMEWKQRHFVFVRFLLERHYGRNERFQTLKPIHADVSESITAVLGKFQRGCKHPIIVSKEGKERGVLDENEILHAYFTDKLTNVKMGDLLYSY
ncbi:stage IV sporulation protein FB [Peribacillus deserti]|uniref:Stage IV sporulation protein FB n=1 Tax=Peribacillus deserti TaxID=673318 RepID=A0ABS2QHZ5_9BACI|nr:M50 family metallopeptidase [Peribacillus deserti]MBM7691916.1 stage IV sporulation protein FB [Peribacillus deserti]